MFMRMSIRMSIRMPICMSTHMSMRNGYAHVYTHVYTKCPYACLYRMSYACLCEMAIRNVYTQCPCACLYACPYACLYAYPHACLCACLYEMSIHMSTRDVYTHVYAKCLCGCLYEMSVRMSRPSRQRPETPKTDVRPTDKARHGTDCAPGRRLRARPCVLTVESGNGGTPRHGSRRVSRGSPLMIKLRARVGAPGEARQARHGSSNDDHGTRRRRRR